MKKYLAGRTILAFKPGPHTLDFFAFGMLADQTQVAVKQQDSITNPLMLLNTDIVYRRVYVVSA